MDSQAKAPEKSVLVVQGPNLNMLGLREPAIYGHETLADIHDRLHRAAQALGLGLEVFQSNHEGALIDRIHQAAAASVDFIVINPAGFTHSSVALRDALAAVAIPFIEVHLSNIQRREAFRHHSYFSDLALGSIVGLGSQGYELALQAAARRLLQA
ncbi:MAG: type II 3-dehydroquinate dehydratase [Betaproteobacteria bacterium]|nr:type II 3-dehydroquinate dehydratase [Betaproteobacteria bacterium]